MIEPAVESYHEPSPLLGDSTTTVTMDTSNVTMDTGCSTKIGSSSSASQTTVGCSVIDGPPCIMVSQPVCDINDGSVLDDYDPSLYDAVPPVIIDGPVPAEEGEDEEEEGAEGKQRWDPGGT